MIVDPNDLRYDKRPRKKPIKKERKKNMSNDLLDKNGVWQGDQKEYYDFAIDILDDACDGEHEQFVESMLSDILKAIPQDKLESIISKHCEGLDDQLDEVVHNQHRLGLLIKVKPKEDSIAKVTIKDTLSVL